jgi:GNAT superfamily N-acetyltransferase
MLRHLDFDERFFRQPCYRLLPEVSNTEWHQFEQLARREAIFADLKVAASDLETACNALQRSFRKICTQVQLIHRLSRVERVEQVAFSDRLELRDDQHRAHAEHFRACRFRQDPLIPTHIATDLYAAWIANSLSGGKRVAALGINFCSFADGNGIRHIDLLSIIEKGRGYATQLLKAVTCDAKSKGLQEVLVTTEVENEWAISAYKAAGFDITSFASVFHFKN